jgi:outer membrane protein W
VTSIFAQSKDRFSIGPRAGINLANVTNVEESESITGLVLGLTSTYSLAEHSGLTLDVLYSVEGYQAPFEEYKLKYIQVTIYFNYFFGELGDRFRPKVMAGIAPSFFTGGTLNELDVNDRFFRKFLIAGSLGAGANYRVANRIWLNADARYFLGLNDIRGNQFDEGDGIFPRTLQLSLGLAYGLAKLD